MIESVPWEDRETSFTLGAVSRKKLFLVNTKPFRSIYQISVNVHWWHSHYQSSHNDLTSLASKIHLSEVCQLAFYLFPYYPLYFVLPFLIFSVQNSKDDNRPIKPNQVFPLFFAMR